jgi:hypothetical protein
MKRRRISDYSKKLEPVPNDHEEPSVPKEIFLARKKNRKVKSLNFQRDNSALALRSTLGREKRVAKGLGFMFHRDSSVSQGLTFSNRTEAREEEIQFNFPKRPLTKRQRQRDDESDCGAPRPNLKVVFDSTTQKHNLVSAGLDLSPSFEVKDESFRLASSPISVINDLSIHLSPTKSQVTMSPEDRSNLRVPIKSRHARILFSSSFYIERESLSAVTATPKDISPVETEKVQSSSQFSKPECLWEAPTLCRRGKRIQDLIAKLGITG